jgi:hypothetical protein
MNTLLTKLAVHRNAALASFAGAVVLIGIAAFARVG